MLPALSQTNYYGGETTAPRDPHCMSDHDPERTCLYHYIYQYGLGV